MNIIHTLIKIDGKYYVDLEKGILLNKLHLNYYIIGKNSLITRVLLAKP